jgi:hypothetical protein
LPCRPLQKWMCPARGGQAAFQPRAVIIVLPREFLDAVEGAWLAAGKA